MKRLIIGIGHKRERGKDTAADYLISLSKEENEISPFKKETFASTIKQGIGHFIFGLSESQLNGIEKHIHDPYWDLSPRQILQRGGAALRAEFGKNFWIRVLTKKILGNTDNIIISDVRFRDEADTIKDMGGYLIKIDRSIPYDVEIDSDKSETDLAYYWGWDYMISNNETIKDLYLKLDKVYENILERAIRV